VTVISGTFNIGMGEKFDKSAGVHCQQVRLRSCRQECVTSLGRARAIGGKALLEPFGGFGSCVPISLLGKERSRIGEAEPAKQVEPSSTNQIKVRHEIERD